MKPKAVVFGEGVLPGYAFWIERTDGARFDSAMQKEIHARYLDQAVPVESGHLDPLCKLAADRDIAIYLGCIKRPLDRGRHSLYCSLVYIDASGSIAPVHRKLVPRSTARAGMR